MGGAEDCCCGDAGHETRDNQPVQSIDFLVHSGVAFGVVFFALRMVREANSGICGRMYRIAASGRAFRALRIRLIEIARVIEGRSIRK